MLAADITPSLPSTLIKCALVGFSGLIFFRFRLVSGLWWRKVINSLGTPAELMSKKGHERHHSTLTQQNEGRLRCHEKRLLTPQSFYYSDPSSFGTTGFQAQLALCAVKAKSQNPGGTKTPSPTHEAHVLAVLPRHLGPRPGRERRTEDTGKKNRLGLFSEDRSPCRERLHTAPHALIIGSENETEGNQEPHVCCSETLIHYVSALEARRRAALRGWFEVRGASRVKCGAHQSTFCSMTLVV